MRRLRSLGMLLVVLAGFALAAPAAPRAFAATAGVSVQDNFYTPASVTINVGDTVHWTWAGANLHTVTATDMSFDSGSPQSSGTFDHSFNSAGTFTYFCQVHGAAVMSGTVVVEQAAAPTSTAQPAASATSAPASTHTAQPGSTVTPLAAATSAARATAPASVTTGATSTKVAAPAGAAGAGAQLPRSGTGGADGSSPSRDVPLAVLALIGVGSIAVAFVVRRQA